VVFDPFASETARLADYVFAPAMNFERHEDTRSYESFHNEGFAQISAPILARPPEVLEDWEIFFELASRLGLSLQIGEQTWDPDEVRPTSRDLMASFANGPIPYNEVEASPRGIWHGHIEETLVGPPDTDTAGRFELLPPDVADELASALGTLRAPGSSRPFTLVARRSKNVMNSLGRRLPIGSPVNPCSCHSSDLATLGLQSGDRITITSDHGAVVAVVAADDTLRPGVVSMTHNFGGLPGEDDDPTVGGTSSSRLLSLTEDGQKISHMPWMSAIPVTIEAEASPT